MQATDKDTPYRSEEKIDKVGLCNLFHKHRHRVQESIIVVLHDHVQIYAVLPARQERLPVFPAVQVGQWLKTIDRSDLRIEIFQDHLHHQRPRVYRLQISSRHLKNQCHRARDSNDNPRASLHPPLLPAH